MMPLYFILLGWLVFLIAYILAAGVTIIQMLRFGISPGGTYMSTFVFLIVAGIAIGGTGILFSGMNWSQSINVASLVEATINLTLP